MNEKDLDIGCTMDGDSDRPLLVYRHYIEGHPTEEIGYITGDILGLLTVLALEAMGVEISAVAVPISANDVPSPPRKIVKRGRANPALIAADNIIKMKVILFRLK